MLTDRYDDALAWACALHRKQTRKGSNIPYVSHLLAVSSLVLENGGDENQAIAGLLHDAAEDQGGEATLTLIRERYGDDVASIVADCTDSFDDKAVPWRERKEAYLAILPDKGNRSLLVSLADKTHNATAILHDYQVLGDDLWDRFSGGPDGVRWYYSELVNVFRGAYPGPLAERLSDVVDGFRD